MCVCVCPLIQGLAEAKSQQTNNKTKSQHQPLAFRPSSLSLASPSSQSFAHTGTHHQPFLSFFFLFFFFACVFFLSHDNVGVCRLHLGHQGQGEEASHKEQKRAQKEQEGREQELLSMTAMPFPPPFLKPTPCPSCHSPYLHDLLWLQGPDLERLPWRLAMELH